MRAHVTVGLFVLVAGCHLATGLDDKEYRDAPVDGAGGSDGGEGGGSAGGGHGGSQAGGEGGSAGAGEGGSAGDGGAGGFTCGEEPPRTTTICPTECTGGCDGDRCVIDCSATQGCRADDITCPAGIPCRVLCTGEQSCKDAHIACPDDHACDVDCNGSAWQGTDSCDHARIDCSATGTCKLSCGNADGACGDTTKLECGGNDCSATCAGSSNSPPDVKCNESCACSPCE
jgi:hypothetical protein